MNFAFLPTRIKENLKGLVAGKVPLAVARSSASIKGNPGEGYVVAFDDKIFLFSRELGGHEYYTVSADFGEVGDLEVRKEGVNAFFDLNIGENRYSMKFSSFEEASLNSVRDAWLSTAGKSKTVESEVPAASVEYKTQPAALKEKFSSRVGLAAALMYVASVDDDIAKEEDYYIIAIMRNDRALLNAGLVYYKSHSFDELLFDLQGISEEEALCFLANMLELGMTDGVLHSSELDLIRRFANYMNIDDSQYNTIKQVLLIKNKISVLGT